MDAPLEVELARNPSAMPLRAEMRHGSAEPRLDVTPLIARQLAVFELVDPTMRPSSVNKANSPAAFVPATGRPASADSRVDRNGPCRPLTEVSTANRVQGSAPSRTAMPARADTAESISSAPIVSA